MAKHYKIFTAIIIAIIFIACNQQKSDLTQSSSRINPDSTKLQPPQVIKVNKDSIPKLTPGENGVPLPKVVKAGKPEIHPIPNLPTIPGVSYLPQTKEEIAEGKKAILSSKPKIIMVNLQ